MFGSSNDKKEKGLKKAEVASTYAPLHSWNDCGCAGACWHGKSASEVTASPLLLARDELTPKTNKSPPRRTVPLSSSPVTEPIQLEDFLKKFEKTGARPKSHKLHLWPEVIIRKFK